MPRRRSASRWSPRASITTAWPPRASRPPKYPPTAPAPRIAILMASRLPRASLRPRRSDPELPEVMVEVLGAQGAPLAARERPEGGVARPLARGVPGGGEVDERADGAAVRVPLPGRARLHLRGGGDLALGPGQPVHEEPADGPEAQEVQLLLGRQIPQRAPQLVAQVADHLGGAHAPPLR